MLLVERSSALTHLVSSLEYLKRPADADTGGINDWSLQRDRFTEFGALHRRVLDVCAKPAMSKLLHVGRVAAAVALLAPTPPRARMVANGFLAVTSILLYPHNHYGTDGADQVSLQTQASMFVARAIPTRSVQDAALWYLALQAGIAYAVSGWVKLAGAPWRDGSAVAGVMRTQTYGYERFWFFFKKYPRVAALAAHGMLACEGLFPLVFVTRGHLTKPAVLWALCFHTGIGATMGLGRFVTAFSSMLPAITYVTGTARKSNDVPLLYLTGLGAALAAGAVGTVNRKRRIDRRAALVHEAIELPDGRSLAIKRTAGPSDNCPILVLEAGLLATPELYSWLTIFTRTSAESIAYYRPGLASSSPRSTAFTVNDAALDLANLVRSRTTENRDVYLVGHSIGGLIARDAARILGDQIAGVVYLDSSHPAQLARSDAQARGARMVREGLEMLPPSLDIGLGWALETPDWLGKLPQSARMIELDNYRDSRLWRTGLHEWNGMTNHFADTLGHVLHPLPHPALVITAGATAAKDPVHAELQEAIVAAHPADSSLHKTVDGAGHLDLLADAQFAHRCATHLLDFIAGASR